MSARQTNYPNEHSVEGQVVLGTDYLNYLADVVLELKEMALKANATTLAGLLEVAHNEARLQMRLKK